MRALVLCGVRVGERPAESFGQRAVLKRFPTGKLIGKDLVMSLEVNSSLILISKEEASTDPGIKGLFPLSDVKGREENEGSVDLCIIRGKEEIRVNLF